MDQHDPYQQQPYPAPQPGAARPGPYAAPVPARPQVVHVVSRPGGFWKAVMFIIALCMFAAVFFVGLLTGVGVMFVGGSVDDVVLKQTYRDGGSQQVAIIPIEGPIDSSRTAFARAAVNYVLADSSIDAVVLRVDSPGGGVTASDEIWYEIERLKRGRGGTPIPVVASYGGLAASGGYYISCGADHIMAEETCITGSIGVIAQTFTLRELMNKVGIEPVTLVATGSPDKDVANNMFRQWDERDRQKVMTMLDSAYEIFTARVRDGRKNVITDESHLTQLARGDIFTAKQASQNGLVDSIGYLDDAIGKAESLAGIGSGRATVLMLHEPPTFFGGELFGEAGKAKTGAWPPLDGESIRSLVNDLASPRVMYLMQ